MKSMLQTLRDEKKLLEAKTIKIAKKIDEYLDEVIDTVENFQKNGLKCKPILDRKNIGLLHCLDLALLEGRNALLEN